MATWQVIAGGVTYNLNDRNPFDVVSVTGIGIAPARRLTQRGPLQHGETDLGYRLDPRVINLVIAYQAASLSAADTHRATLAAIFRARDEPIKLRYTRDDASARQIDCHAIGLTDWPVTDTDRIGAFQRVGVQLFCPDPYWYAPEAVVSGISELAGNWYLAGGLIDESNVIAHGTGITTPTTWNTGGEPYREGTHPSYWSVVVRTRRDDSGTDRNFMWSAEATGFWTETQNGMGYAPETDRFFAMIPWGATFAWPLTDDDLHVFIRVSAREGEQALWIDDSLTSWGLVPDYMGLPDTSRYWGADSTGANAWGEELTHVAAYNIALTDAQAMALYAILTSGETFGTLTNGGDTDAYPIIQINGPATNPTITNLTTGEKLAVTITLLEGHSLIIDTRYGHKTVVDHAGTSKMAQMSADSDLATWRLLPGENVIRVQVSDVGGFDGAIVFTWYDRYFGA